MFCFWGQAATHIAVLIKLFSFDFQLARWSALVAGIYWGGHRYAINKAAEDAWRAEDAKHQVVRDAKMAEEKAKLTREELIYLAGQAGVKVPENF